MITLNNAVHKTAQEWLKERGNLAALCEQGYTVAEMARMYKTTPAIVATALNSFGLKTQHVRLRDELAELVKQQEQSRG